MSTHGTSAPPPAPAAPLPPPPGEPSPLPPQAAAPTDAAMSHATTTQLRTTDDLDR